MHGPRRLGQQALGWPQLQGAVGSHVCHQADGDRGRGVHKPPRAGRETKLGLCAGMSGQEGRESLEEKGTKARLLPVRSLKGGRES